jgi:hypothetical protein
MKNGAKYGNHHDQEKIQPGTMGKKFDDSNPWRKMKKEKDLEKEKENDEINPNYYFIVPWQMF